MISATSPSLTGVFSPLSLPSFTLALILLGLGGPLVSDNAKFEFTTLRKDIKTDGRHAEIETIDDWKEDSLNLIAKMPRLMGLIFRYREGRESNIPADDLSLPLVGRFTNTLDLDGIDKAVMNRVLSTYLVLHMDHGGGNLSTFAGKAVASGHATVYSSMAGAMNALSGPLHGRANQSCLEFVLRVGTSDPEEVNK